MSLIKNFQDHIQRNHLCSLSEFGLLAVSGGMDSMVMADLFFRSGYRFAVAHGNFLLRGQESDQDEEFIKQWCQLKNIIFHSQRFQTEKIILEEGISVQMGARKLRYTWFEHLCENFGYAYYGVAHHKNDNLETVLINLTRGTGIAGLRGMPVKSGKLIRPLLAFSKEEIEKEAKEFQIPFREDSSNASLKYIRNRIRWEVIPVLKEINPIVETTVHNHLPELQWTEILAKERLDQLKITLLEKEAGIWKISKQKILEFGIYASEALFSLIEEYGFTSGQSIDLINSFSRSSGAFYYSSTYKILLDRDYLFLEPLNKFNNEGEYSNVRNLDGRNNLESDRNLEKWGDLVSGGDLKNAGDFDKEENLPHRVSGISYELDSRLQISFIKEESEVKQIKWNLDLIKKTNLFKIPDPNNTHNSRIDLEDSLKNQSHAFFNGDLINEDHINEKLKLRFWEHGDEFIPLGMKHPKKLSDFFVDLKIPVNVKNKIPLIIYQGEIIWIVGYRINDRFKVLKNSCLILELMYK